MREGVTPFGGGMICGMAVKKALKMGKNCVCDTDTASVAPPRRGFGGKGGIFL